MSIASRIDAIEQHLQDDYSVLELAGADLTNIDKNIQNLKPTWKERLLYFLANGTDVVWNNWLPKVNGTGETITLNNTIEAKMDFVYKGNTSQTGTPTPDSPIPIQVVSGDNTIKVEGNNLFNPSDVIASNKTTVSNDEITINDDTNWGAGYVICGSKIKEGTYTVSLVGNTNQLKVIVRGYVNGSIYEQQISGKSYSSYYKASTFGTTSNNKLTITLPDTCDYYYVGIALGFTGTEIFKVQVEKRDTNTAYQPYTLQTYPINLGNIELCKIGTYQDYIRKSSGKNLFEYEYILVPNDNNKNAHLKQGTYTISTESGNNFGTNIYFKLFDSNGNAITKSGHLTSSNAQINFSTSSYNYYGGSGSSYIIFTIDNDYTLTIGQLNADGTKRVMLNEGNTVLPYEPYGTSWYLNKQIGKVVLDGSESTWGLSGNNRGFTLTGANEKFTSRNTNVYDGFCNYFNVNKNSTTWASTNYCGWNTINTFWIREDGQIASTVADFKIWLSTHNVLVYYVLATPTYEEITDAKLISQLETIKSVNGQTNISQENNDLPFILDVVALKGI